jgi:hypothetical protein
VRWSEMGSALVCFFTRTRTSEGQGNGIPPHNLSTYNAALSPIPAHAGLCFSAGKLISGICEAHSCRHDVLCLVTMATRLGDIGSCVRDMEGSELNNVGAHSRHAVSCMVTRLEDIGSCIMEQV